MFVHVLCLVGSYQHCAEHRKKHHQYVTGEDWISKVEFVRFVF